MKKNLFTSNYTAPDMEMQLVIVESGYQSSTFGVGIEGVGDLEELE